MDRDRIAAIIALVVLVAWVVSFILDAAWPAYDPPPTIHALMMLVAGWAFGERLLRKGNDA
jgi:lipopolysaccharide export LptBFGC system permease protein LptF